VVHFKPVLRVIRAINRGLLKNNFNYYKKGGALFFTTDDPFVLEVWGGVASIKQTLVTLKIKSLKTDL
jgi:hypothetical protein